MVFVSNMEKYPQTDETKRNGWGRARSETTTETTGEWRPTHIPISHPERTDHDTCA